MAIQKQNLDCDLKRRIFIVGDHPVARQGLITLINQQSDLLVCGEAEDARDALELIEALMPDMAIIDISNKGFSGISLVRNISAKHSNILVLVLSTHDESIIAELVLREGAKGYIMKIEPVEKILMAIRRVLNEEIYVSENIASKILQNFINNKYEVNKSQIELLSKREKEIMRLIGQGYGINQIAKELYLGVKTIETHRAHIRKKLKMENNSELVKLSIKLTQNQLLD